nr:hypothetical protein [uncultured Desulfobulbus sp.]
MKRQKAMDIARALHLPSVAFAVVIPLALAWLVLVSPALAQTENSNVGKEVNEAVEAIGQYSIEQKDAALADAHKLMNKLDKRIEVLEAKIKEGAQEKYSSSLETLKQKRKELSKQYASLKASSGDVWDEMKQGFSNAYDALTRSWDNIEEDLANDDA